MKEEQSADSRPKQGTRGRSGERKKHGRGRKDRSHSSGHSHGKTHEEGATVQDLNDEIHEEKEECRTCGISREELGEALRTCSRCHQAKYCSRTCQKADWRAEHKFTCGDYALDLD